MKNKKKTQVLTKYEKGTLLGGFRSALGLNHNVAECEDPTCSCQCDRSAANRATE